VNCLVSVNNHLHTGVAQQSLDGWEIRSWSRKRRQIV